MIKDDIKERNSKTKSVFFTPLSVGAALGYFLGSLIGDPVGDFIGSFIMGPLGYSKDFREAIPQISEVQENFVPTSNLEIKVEDLDRSDGKGLPETYISLGDSNYVLIYDKSGRPTLKTYSFEIEGD